MRGPFTTAAALVTVGAIAFLAPSTTAFALWSDQASATVKVSISSAVSAPRTLTCSGDKVAAVSLTWSAPTGPAPIRYEVYYAADNSLIKNTTVTSTTVSEAELAGNSTWMVGVRAVQTSGQKSTLNPTVSISQDQGQGGRVSCGGVVNP